MELIAGFLAVGLVIAIAAVLVVREAGRIARDPPPALFDLDEAHAWVVDHLPDDVAATLTAADVERIIALQVEFFGLQGISSNGSTAYPPAIVVIGGPDTVAYIVERSAATGEAYLPEQVHGVLETEIGYLRSIGALGPEAGGEGPDPAGDTGADGSRS